MPASKPPTLGISVQQPSISFEDFMRQNAPQQPQHDEQPEETCEDASSGEEGVLREVRYEALPELAGPARMQEVALSNALYMANAAVPGIQRAQYMGQPFGTVVLNMADAASARGYLRAGRVGRHVVHRLLGSRFGVLNPYTGRLELLADVPPRQGMLDYGHACHADALRCTLMPDEIGA